MRERLSGRTFGILFVNAGVSNHEKETIGEVSSEEFVRVMVANSLGPMRVVEDQSNQSAAGSAGNHSSVVNKLRV